MTVVFFDQNASVGQAHEDLSSMILTQNSFSAPAVRASVPRLPGVSDPDDDSDAPRASHGIRGDERQYALMAGRYLGQITARIERAWVKPKDPIDEGVFTCRVRITQDALGGIQQVSLGRCNGDQRWQLSLLNAIKTASPLPGAPDPSVFAGVLTLEMRSVPYFYGAGEEGFER